MSSWRKASNCTQKVHRERHQPEHRSHLGLLEKKKDHTCRAQDAEKKKRSLQLLHKRALNKNLDEFYYHMINSKLRDDEHHEKPMKNEYSRDQVALMETQNSKYVTIKRTIERRKIERIQSQMHLTDVANSVPNKHIFFVDNEETAKNLNVSERLGTHPSLLARKTNRVRLEDLEKMELNELSPTERRKANTLKAQTYSELEKRLEREKMLAVVQQELNLKRRLQQKRSIKPTKIKKGTKNEPATYKFHYERKK